MLRVLLVLSHALSVWSFQPPISYNVFSSPTSSKLGVVADETYRKVLKVFEDAPEPNPEFDKIVKSHFPDALTNEELTKRVVKLLGGKGYTGSNTLVATSLCCDELARRLEDDFVNVYGNNFNLGGLSGFPFAGNTGFGAMSAHIPDDGYCLVIYGPHVGVAADGTVGKVERSGIKLLDNCCGSAIAASNFLKGITDGGAPVSTKIKKFSDFQQGAVQELILPHGKRLSDAKNRMLELPYALYDSQDMLVQKIVMGGISGTKKGIALLGGIQINTGPSTLDYFHPLRFDYMNNKGEILDELLPSVMKGDREEEDDVQAVLEEAVEAGIINVEEKSGVKSRKLSGFIKKLIKSKK